MDNPNSEARERVLEAAERLFSERGYAAITIKDIAQAAGIHHASLYHHSPGGKEELFVEVTERNLIRHQQGIEAAISAGGDDLRTQLQGVAAWLLAQPPMDFIRMIHSDWPAINPAAAERLSDLAFASLFMPIVHILVQAEARGDIEHHDFGNIGGAIFSSLEALHTIPKEHLEKPLLMMATELIDVFIRGLR